MFRESNQYTMNKEKTYCLATNNQHKVEELQQMLGGIFELKTLADIGCQDEIEEIESTLEGNSLLKARYIFDRYGINCIADDSGLEVNALNGEPGVFSARYAGEPSNPENNMAKLLSKLESFDDKSASFRTSITLIENGEVRQFEGIVKGEIIAEKRGSGGFGYDPIFIPEGLSKTFAEMSPEEKNPISHRGLAIAKLIDYLKK